MTVSYKKLRGLSKTVRGVVGFFIHSSYQVQNQIGNNAQLAIKGHQVAIEWSQMTKRISCWRFPRRFQAQTIRIHSTMHKIFTIIY